MHILAFIGFLMAYVAWLWVATVAQKKTISGILKNKTFWSSQLGILLGTAPLFVFVFVLTGYCNWFLIAAFFAASQIGVVLTAILGGLLGSSTSKWGPRAAWVGGEFGIEHAPMMLVMIGFCLLVILAYPVVTGISYFSLPASGLPVRIFQYTLSMSFLAGYPFLFFVLIGALVSENLDEQTRVRFFISQLGALIPNALWLALLFWSFGIAGGGQNVKVGGVALTLSPLLLGVLIAFFVLTVLIPFLIGAQRAKQLRTSLLEKRKEWMRKLEDILETPAGSLYSQKLADLEQALAQDTDEFINRDQMIAAGLQIDQGNTPPALKEIAPAYQLTRNLDPRFQHLDWLRELLVKLDEIRNDLAKLTAEPALEKAAKEWVKYLHPRQESLSNELRQTRKMRTPLVLISSGVIVPILSVVLSEFSKWLWTYFSKSLPQ